MGILCQVGNTRQARPRIVEPFEVYLRERVLAFPDLSGARLLREIRQMGYDGGYTAVTDFLRDVRPPKQTQFERRFETPPGKQAQVDFAEFSVEFTDEPGVIRKVWLFSMVLGHSRWLGGGLSPARTCNRFFAVISPPSTLWAGWQNILRDDWARWDEMTGTWEVAAIFDHAHCDRCDKPAATK